MVGVFKVPPPEGQAMGKLSANPPWETFRSPLVVTVQMPYGEAKAGTLLSSPNQSVLSTKRLTTLVAALVTIVSPLDRKAADMGKSTQVTWSDDRWGPVLTLTGGSPIVPSTVSMRVYGKLLSLFYLSAFMNVIMLTYHSR
jgi:hypothetical protein